jgi:prephenate dehydrogenase
MAQPVKVLILGTGTVGASIGLALRRAGAGFERIGFDPDPQKAQQAEKAGAVDRLVRNPAGAARQADLAILSLPGIVAVEAAEVIAGNLPPETIVLFTHRLQSQLLEQLRAKLRPDNPCLGTVPFVGPAQALAPSSDIDIPAAGLFDGGQLGIVAPAGTPEGAIEIALDLAAILGATPFFLDSAELDSVTATSDELPGVVAAALLESLEANPGWRDQQRLVGRPFARLAGLLEADPAEVAAEWNANRASLLARLDALAESLADLRDLLTEEDEAALAAKLASATARYQAWREVRASSEPDHGVEFAQAPRINALERLLGGGLAKKKG